MRGDGCGWPATPVRGLLVINPELRGSRLSVLPSDGVALPRAQDVAMPEGGIVSWRLGHVFLRFHSCSQVLHPALQPLTVVPAGSIGGAVRPGPAGSCCTGGARADEHGPSTPGRGEEDPMTTEETLSQAQLRLPGEVQAKSASRLLLPPGARWEAKMQNGSLRLMLERERFACRWSMAGHGLRVSTTLFCSAPPCPN